MKNYFFIAVILLIIAGCKEPYISPAAKANNNFLVVDGIIQTNSDSPTVITLTRTRNLVDTVVRGIPELFANVSIEGEGGDTHALLEKGDGNYAIEHLNLNNTSKYKLTISTSNGSKYESDFVPVKITPPIDTVTWKQPDDLTVYLNTHDPANNTKYYRWEFTETSEYHSFYQSNVIFTNGQLHYIDPPDYVDVCWRSANSTNIIIGSSVALSKDIIADMPVTTVHQGLGKIDTKYSINIKQYAITQEAFQYLQILQKNTEQQGTIFDPQPSQLTSNIHCITNPDEPVIGYMSVASVQEKRIFIKRTYLHNWYEPETGTAENCAPIIIPIPQAATYLESPLYVNYSPAYYVSGGGLAIAMKSCIDCTLKGGTNHKPPFWK